ncbi:hypothetical protein RchiOBHm_Chr4g0398731 [Rosa chinensis]|uniref:Uncharacterized protein n=2 Tax=Rosa chinensis TaxID=74649 RepID=A0A2P6QSD7_ROSCH|nr:hypothetical protein RchiOBHm_Chr4g0398731 [Rosa chinensis]
MGFEIQEEFRPITPIRVVPVQHPTVNSTEDALEECLTPKSPAARMILKQPLVCPPAPKKPPQPRRKLRSPSKELFKVPDDFASVLRVISTSAAPTKKIRAS